MPTQEELNHYLSYDPSTGYLKNKVCRGKTHIGQVIGSRNTLGYIAHTINNTRMLTHRIIWVMLYGSIPRGMVVDHINGIRSDNRIGNLRLVSHQMNMRNSKRHKHNTSGMMGVRWIAETKKWEASIKHGSEKIYLGRFPTFEEAAACRKQAEVDNGFHPNHGRVVS